MKTNVRQGRADLESLTMGTIPAGHRTIFMDAGESPASEELTPPTEPLHPLITPATPPMQPVPSGDRSTWPTVLGTIAIIFGAGGILGGVWGIVSPAVMEALVSSAPGPAPESFREMLDVMSAWRVWTTPLALLGIGAAGLLLAAGVLVIKRRPKATKALKMWAVLRIVLVLAGCALGLVLQNSLKDVSGAPPLQIAWVIALFGLLWGCALPVFILVWLTREGVKTEIRRWE